MRLTIVLDDDRVVSVDVSRYKRTEIRLCRLLQSAVQAVLHVNTLLKCFAIACKAEHFPANRLMAARRCQR